MLESPAECGRLGSYVTAGQSRTLTSFTGSSIDLRTASTGTVAVAMAESLVLDESSVLSESAIDNLRLKLPGKLAYISSESVCTTLVIFNLLIKLFATTSWYVKSLSQISCHESSMLIVSRNELSIP